MSTGQIKTQEIIPGVIANAAIFAMLMYMAVLDKYYPELYYLNVQEDEFLEWATFWAFALAAGAWIWAAVRQRLKTGAVPWFFTCLALFCLVVAMEEISWAQRIFSYRPPAYFLAENFQQELNFHNFASKDSRKILLYIILSGYGILLPILARIPVTRRLLDVVGVVAPPLGLLPAFTAALILTFYYPWEFTNETVELMMAAGFLFAAVASVVHFSGHERERQVRNRSLGNVTGVVLVVVLGLSTVAMARYGRAHDPHTLEMANMEIEALRRDFLEMTKQDDETFPNRRNIHKRIYAYENKYGEGYLYAGEFTRLVARGLPQERADFFLDPWNDPYWIKIRWNTQRTRLNAFVYSFGPNRRRDSNRTELLGDDIGAYIFRDEPVTGR